jgi:hypothetical protein
MEGMREGTWEETKKEVLIRVAAQPVVLEDGH